MKIQLNCTPHLRMDEITKKLFNEKFLADIQFSVKGKVIHAHSFELMKRSVVFQHQLQDTWGVKQLIPITDFKYESFLEFIRFIYTDECTITDENGIDLLNLAIKYQVIMLENRVINLLYSLDWRLQLFENCVTKNYEIPRKQMDLNLTMFIEEYLKCKKFESLDVDALNEILQFERVAEGVTEIQFFKALARWLYSHCREHGIPLSDGRQKFDHLIKKIRFPTMPIEDIRACFTKYPEILNENDLYSIVEQILCHNGGDVWISGGRKCVSLLGWPVEHYTIPDGATFTTIFSVSKDLILHGLRIGSGIKPQEKYVEVEIWERSLISNEVSKFQFRQPALSWCSTMLISLGGTWRLKPNFEYTIYAKYPEFTKVYGRKENVDLLYDNPDNSIKIMKASCNMVEMIFKLPPE